MKSQYTIIFFILLWFLGCSTHEVERSNADNPRHEIEQIINMDISHVDPATVRDGEYIGEFPFMERLLYQVRVTVKSGKIVNIEVLQNGTENEYAKKGLGVVPRILQKQSPEVDVVTGSTVTSKSLMKCVEEALNKGRKGEG
ncbi:FMN-binding protein [bacterium]|nr:FMN-binding protein [bacterium]